MSRLPALDAWSACAVEHARFVEFLEWLERSQAIALGPQSAACPFKQLDDFKPYKLADAFLGIDRAALNRERRELLQQEYARAREKTEQPDAADTARDGVPPVRD